MRNLLVAGLFLSVMLSSACSAPLHQPKLDDIYGPAARTDAPERNPVIVIPGVLGSKLAGPAGEVVWGAFGGGSENPRKPRGARLLALPMRPGVPLAGLVDGVKPNGALDRVRISLFGLPFQQRAYADILGLLGAAGYVDPALASGLAPVDASEADRAAATTPMGMLDWGEGHFTCFQFAYDWRRDNAENAALLHRFMLERRAEVQAERARRYGGTPQDHPVRFDVIAHSMGGLVARHQLRYGGGAAGPDPAAPVPWSGAPLVSKLVMIGTPNAGSAKVLTNLIDGATFGPFLPAYAPQILGTMPALYQLLPRGRHDSLLDEDGAALDPLSPEVWVSRGWGLADPDADGQLAVLLPGVDDPAERRRIALDHQAKALRRASAFQAAMDRPAAPPAGTEIFLVAGDAVATASAMRAGRGGAKPHAHAPGDGTVTRASALLDERPAPGEPGWTTRLQSPLAYAGVTFLHTNHLGLTRDPAFSDNVLWLLLERPAPAAVQRRP
ncbi:lipase/acyltransferase domain-containing protein [Phycisphaera mikurensis]|uniref:AB hydrolase-1 domain-containing protein n=1 Tax=Phycisphaera mikurensis (strain NBRC 102666 / KCTC 22515 / FYK2301M01) TaxID=1142394 RepID=I0II69_PHYMF|nr:hypothetical protein [Phycisphaera mikurensis]MBB6442480.1 hypothetical protein [Phycisphaera mikurensis]BAM04957.1 hypothetical protein PSMK_27980 [Phycisphaera mikurensis NBRC 102666]